MMDGRPRLGTLGFRYVGVLFLETLDSQPVRSPPALLLSTLLYLSFCCTLSAKVFRCWTLEA